MDPQKSPPQRPTSPGSPRASATSILRRSVHGSSQHAPATPSSLRESHQPDSSAILPVETMSRPQSSRSVDRQSQASPQAHSFDIDAQDLHPAHSDHASPVKGESGAEVEGGIDEPSATEADIRTRLLDDYHKGAACGNRHCNHGTFSPRFSVQSSPGGSISSQNGFGGRYPGHAIDEGTSSQTNRLLGDTIADGLLGGTGSGKDSKMSTTKWLAETHGVKHSRRM